MLYGSADGLVVDGNQLWRANGRGVRGKAGEDFFGQSLAAGNLGKDRAGWTADDLVIGAPWNHADRGSVHVLYGSSAGLTSRGDQVWRQSSPRVDGITEEGDRFGSGLVVADFGNNEVGQRTGDVAVSSPGETVSGIGAAGSVHVLSSTTGGLQAGGAQLWTEDRLGGSLTDGGSTGEGFGTVLASR